LAVEWKIDLNRLPGGYMVLRNILFSEKQGQVCFLGLPWEELNTCLYGHGGVI